MRDHEAAIALEPQDGVPYNNCGFTLHALKQYEASIADYERAMDLTPEHPNAYKNLAWLLASCPDDSYRDGERAVQLAETAMRLTEGRQTAWYAIVAAAHAAVRNFETACQHQQQAIAAVTAGDRAEQTERLAMYKRGEAIRE